MKPAIFVLGPKNIITDPNVLLRQALTQGFVSDVSQSVLHDEIFSFQYINSLYGNDPTEHANALQEGLRAYYRRLFPDGVEVTVTEKNPGEEIRYTLDIDVRVIYEGSSYGLRDALLVDSQKDFMELQGAIDG